MACFWSLGGMTAVDGSQRWRGDASSVTDERRLHLPEGSGDQRKGTVARLFSAS